MNSIARVIRRVSCVAMTLIYAPVTLAAGDWFPKVSSADDMTTGGKSAMVIASTYVKQGMALLMFMACIAMFVKFIATVAHGIEESKKSEGGATAIFGTYMVMGIIYLGIGMVTGYLGYTIITKFQL